MKQINLRKLYPEVYQTDVLLDVSEEVFDAIELSERAEAAYRRRTYYHHAHYSLDRGDGIAHDALLTPMTPFEICARKITMEQLHAAIASLPEKQAKRINAHFFLGMTAESIAKSERVSVSAVNRSIQKGLYHIEKFLKKIL